MFNKKGFTLAEVLITLGIIGIVAAITIPTIINNVQDYQLKQAWKKEFSTLQQATVRVLQDIGNFKGAFLTYYAEDLKNEYVNYLKTLKICSGDPVLESTFGSCWHALGVTRYLSGGSIGNNAPMGNGAAGVILQDGAYVIFAYNDATCTNQNDAGHGEGLSACGWITVDVNGAKSPNMLGKDTFGVWILQDRIVPWGTNGNSTTCTNANTGFGCSAQYLNQ